MDLLIILRIILFIFFVIIAILLVINKDAENQNKIRIAFILLVLMFIVQFLII